MTVCTCGHDIDDHYADKGCLGGDTPDGDFCLCDQPPSAVADHQIAAVRELHTPIGINHPDNSNTWVQVCEHCWEQGHALYPDAPLNHSDPLETPWPCATIRTLDNFVRTGT